MTTQCARGIIAPEDVPALIRERCGERNSERINSLISDLIENSTDGVIKMSPDMREVYDFFHKYMFDAVYRNPACQGARRARYTG